MIRALAAGLLAAVAIATPARACGEAARSMTGHGPLVVGDSVTAGAASDLEHRGFRVDAIVCRTMPDGIRVLERRRRRRAIVALGSNGTVTRLQLFEAWGLVGHLALVTPRGPAGHRDADARLIRGWARRHHVPVVDWARVSRGHPGWFIDGLHLTRRGGRAFARQLARVAW